MSCTSNIHAERFTEQSLIRRTVAEIQGKVIERGKRNAVSRAFHSKTDKDAIAAWRQDLTRILQIFNVRSDHFIWQLLKRSFADGAVDGYPHDGRRYSSECIGKPGRLRYPTSICECNYLAVDNRTLIVSQMQTRSVAANVENLGLD